MLISPISFDFVNQRLRDNSTAFFGGATTVNFRSDYQDDAYSVELSDEAIAAAKASNTSVISISQGMFLYSRDEMIAEYTKNYSDRFSEAEINERVDVNGNFRISERELRNIDEMGWQKVDASILTDRQNNGGVYTAGAIEYNDSFFAQCVFSNKQERDDLFNYVVDKLRANGVDYEVAGVMNLSVLERKNGGVWEKYIAVNQGLSMAQGLTQEQIAQVSKILDGDNYLIDKISQGWNGNSNVNWHSPTVSATAATAQNTASGNTQTQNATANNQSDTALEEHIENIVNSRNVKSAYSPQKSDAKQPQLVEDAKTLREVLGIGGSGDNVKEIISALNRQIANLQNDGATKVKEILAEQNITLGENEKFALTVAKNGKIKVSNLANPVGEKISKDRLKEIENALNADEKSASALAKTLQETALKEKARNELASNNEPKLSNATALGLIQAQLGVPLSEIVGVKGFSENTPEIAAFVKQNGDLAEKILAVGVAGVAKVEAKFTFTGETLASAQSEDVTQKTEAMLKKTIAGEIELYFENLRKAKMAATNDLIYDEFEVEIDAQGKVKVIGGKMLDGTEAKGRMKDLIAGFLPEGGEDMLSTFVKMKMDQQAAETGENINDLTHSVRFRASKQAAKMEFTLMKRE